MNRRTLFLTISGLFALFLCAPAWAQRPYIGFAYPAGGQQGTTFQVRLGGQGVDDIHAVQVTGAGVTAKVIECRRRLGPQETQLLNEQVREVRKAHAPILAPGAKAPARPSPLPPMPEELRKLLAKIDVRLTETTNRPACNAISNIVIIEVTIASDAPPGRRELTVSSLTGVSNALVFFVGQYPETTRKHMLTAEFQVLGKEALALRKRPDDEIEKQITLPATLNGQIASGEVNRYRFSAKKGQKLVFATEARSLNPFVADAVPGWFQPVLSLYDGSGKEVAYCDDFRFRPDPVILFDVPKDGEYLLAITDAIYRGREDFVYRITAGEIPFITTIFPLGAKAGATATTEFKGWNLQSAKLIPPPVSAFPGLTTVAAARNGQVSNRVSFALDSLPEMVEREPNSAPPQAQKVTLPIMINGRIDKVDDWDVFMFSGKAGQTVVVEVQARRLESPLDSTIKLTDPAGKVIAFSDDREDPEAGTNTQDADSYLMATLPADGNYFVHIADTARQGGEDHAYRMRISAPMPNFALRIVPSSASIRTNKGVGSIGVNVQVLRKDGFNAPIKLSLKDPPQGFSAAPVVLAPGKPSATINIKSELGRTPAPVSLCIEGSANVGDYTLSHCAVPVEDRMQAFLWRHMVPAQEFKVMVFDPNYQPPPKRVCSLPLTLPPSTQPAATRPTTAPDKKQTFTKQQVNGRLRQLKLLFEEGLLTEPFYQEKVLECEAIK